MATCRDEWSIGKGLSLCIEVNGPSLCLEIDNQGPQKGSLSLSKAIIKMPPNRNSRQQASTSSVDDLSETRFFDFKLAVCCTEEVYPVTDKVKKDGKICFE